MGSMIRIGVLISGGGTNLEAIFSACSTGNTAGEVVFVGADRPGAPGLERAKKRNVPSFIVDYSEIKREYSGSDILSGLPADCDLDDILSRQRIEDLADQKRRDAVCHRIIAENRLLEQMNRYSFDLLVLAGFMRKLTPYFIDRVSPDPFFPKIMNIHPSLLPAFPGTDGYGDTFRYGCKVGGCTVHFVDYGEDTGPIIAQRAFLIDAEDTLESVRKKGLALEWELYPKCIDMFARGRIKIVEGHGRRITVLVP